MKFSDFLKQKETILQWFDEFCCQTSMHGWRFIGNRNAGFGLQALFWSLVIMGSMGALTLFSHEVITEYTSSTIKVDLKDRSAPLDKAFFPSVVICNINPLRRSFIYWLAKNLKLEGNKVSRQKLFEVLSRNFFRTSNSSISSEDTALMEKIFKSGFYQEKFGEFLSEREMVKPLDNQMSNGKVFLSSGVGEDLPPYNSSTRFLHVCILQ